MERDESKIDDGIVILKADKNFGKVIIEEDTKDFLKGCPTHDELYDYIKPNHYILFPGMEDTFEIHKAYLTREEYIGWIKGTILKYKIRMGEKPGESFDRDMAKVNVYRGELNEYLKHEK